MSSTLYAITNPDTDTGLGPGEAISSGINNTLYLRAIGGGPGQVGHFLFAHDFSGTFALDLTGQNRTTMMLGPITVADSVGDFPQLRNSFSVGATVGTITGLVLVGFLAVVLYLRRRSAAAVPDDLRVETGVAEQDDSDRKAIGSVEPSSPSPAISMLVDASPVTYPIAQTVPIPIFPIAPMSSESQHHQPVQDQMQVLQLTSHPRSNAEIVRPAIVDASIAQSIAHTDSAGVTTTTSAFW
ncbi:hypothetical protein BGX23_004502 [Mortierella sp. AD031]|nr:hypothetical protein BGX23_004502 [Mortierella sp. AD031]